MTDNPWNVLTLLVLVSFVLWRIVHSLRRSDEPSLLLKKWGGTVILVGIGIKANLALLGAGGYTAGFGVPIVTAGIAIPLSILWASSWGEMLSSPLTALFDGGNTKEEAKPLYAIAEARRKRGRYQEAIDEVNKQLETFPGDLNGTLLLVDLYARDLKQMPFAQEATESFLSHGPHHPKNSFLALAHLADAYLTHASDREQAQKCLERVLVLCEGTEQELMAAQRLAHLTSNEQLEANAAPKRVALQQYERKLGIRTSPRIIRPKQKSAEQLANEYIQQLEAHPLDLEARENLARLYADHYGRLDMAIEQLETMVNFRNQSPRQIVRWLNIMADLHIKVEGNIGNAKACLERICQSYPNTAHAAQANKRIHLLMLEKKGRHQ